jgi:DNA-binding NarL/FixJ family response regulator
MKPKVIATATRKILIVDDHPMMREGLRGIIKGETDLEICGEAENAHQALQLLTKLKPDLVLLDITLPGKNGLELIKDIKVMYPLLPMLVLSMHDESLYAERVLRAGAGGYITKQQRPQALLSAMRQVLAGRTYVSEEVSERILKHLSGRAVMTASPLEALTDREFEIFQLIGEGESTAQIAKHLHLSPKTVAVHYANIRRKLKLAAYPDLIRFAVRLEESRNIPRLESL